MSAAGKKTRVTGRPVHTATSTLSGWMGVNGVKMMNPDPIIDWVMAKKVLRMWGQTRDETRP